MQTRLTSFKRRWIIRTLLDELGDGGDEHDVRGRSRGDCRGRGPRRRPGICVGSVGPPRSRGSGCVALDRHQPAVAPRGARRAGGVAPAVRGGRRADRRGGRQHRVGSGDRVRHQSVRRLPRPRRRGGGVRRSGPGERVDVRADGRGDAGGRRRAAAHGTVAVHEQLRAGRVARSGRRCSRTSPRRGWCSRRETP